MLTRESARRCEVLITRLKGTKQGEPRLDLLVAEFLEDDTGCPL